MTVNVNFSTTVTLPPSAFAKASADLSAGALARGGARRSFSEGGLSSIMGKLDVKTVHLIRSVSHPDQTYVGVTFDPVKRLAEHNAGRSPHTSKYCPWELVVALEFADHHKANAFERYLKLGSGRAFANRHFW